MRVLDSGIGDDDGTLELGAWVLESNAELLIIDEEYGSVEDGGWALD